MPTFSNREQTPTHLDLQAKEVNTTMQMDIDKPKVNDMLANVCMQIDVAMPTSTMMQFISNLGRCLKDYNGDNTTH
jgi:hypothetical protein